MFPEELPCWTNTGERRIWDSVQWCQKKGWFTCKLKNLFAKKCSVWTKASVNCENSALKMTVIIAENFNE